MKLGPRARGWLADATGVPPDTLRVDALAGATSSTVLLVSEAGGRRPDRFVLRVLDRAAWLAEEPDLVAHEVAALAEARRTGLPVPELVAAADGDVGFGAPVVLMTYLPGRVVLEPTDRESWLRRLAGAAAAVHRHPADGFAWTYRHWVDEAACAPPVWSTRPRDWERAIEVWRDATAVPGAAEVQAGGPLTFIHRDFHPANVLFRSGTVSGVVDWVNACRGPAGVDVAHCRVNLVLLSGPALADRFLAAYQHEAPGYEHDPGHDLTALLDTALPSPEFYEPWRVFGVPVVPAPELRRRSEQYLERVLATLA